MDDVVINEKGALFKPMTLSLFWLLCVLNKWYYPMVHIQRYDQFLESS